MDPAEIKEQIVALRERLAMLEAEQHRIDKQLVEIKSDLHYIKAGQDNLNSNLSKFLWIVGGGFLAGIISWVLRGGLS